MEYLAATTDTLEIIRSSAATVDTKVSYVEAVKSTGAWSTADREVHNFNTAATGTILAAPGASNFRTVKRMSIANKDATLACTVTLQHNANSTIYVLGVWTLNAGDVLMYDEGIGFFVIKPNTTRSGLKNVSTADQSMTAATATYITGSSILLPASSLLVAGMILRWRLAIGKTAAGTGTSSFDIRFGTAGSTADTSRCASGAFDTETAAVDEAVVEIQAIIRGPIGASCIVQSLFMMDNAGAAGNVGFSNTVRKAQVKRVASSAFDITPAGTIAGLSMTSGASDVVTVYQATAELLYTGG